jgi:hypothetical protein
MQFIWHDVKIEDIIEAQNLAREHGKVAGNNYEEEFLEVMKKKGIIPSGATELTKEELLNEIASHDKKVAHIQTDDKGKQTLKIYKKEDEPHI